MRLWRFFLLAAQPSLRTVGVLFEFRLEELELELELVQNELRYYDYVISV